MRGGVFASEAHDVSGLLLFFLHNFFHNTARPLHRRRILYSCYDYSLCGIWRGVSYVRSEGSAVRKNNYPFLHLLLDAFSLVSLPCFLLGA